MKKMKKSIILLRTVYIWGMIADLIEGIRMSVPKLFITSSGTMLKESPELVSGLLYGVPVMIGWTLLLFWANLKPVERKGILLCLIPVIIGYMIIQTIGIASGVYTLSNLALSFAMQTVLLILAVIGYGLNRNTYNSKKDI